MRWRKLTGRCLWNEGRRRTVWLSKRNYHFIGHKTLFASIAYVYLNRQHSVLTCTWYLPMAQSHSLELSVCGWLDRYKKSAITFRPINNALNSPRVKRFMMNEQLISQTKQLHSRQGHSQDLHFLVSIVKLSPTYRTTRTLEARSAAHRRLQNETPGYLILNHFQNKIIRWWRRDIIKTTIKKVK